MRYAIITQPTRLGQETKETFWLLDEIEGGILQTALAEYVSANRKKRRAAKLLEELDNVPNYKD